MEQLDIVRAVEARVTRFLRDDVKNSALSSNYGTFEELGQRRASRGFAAIADLENSAFSSNFGTTRRWSSRDVEMSSC